MTHEEQRVWLIDQLRGENSEYTGMRVPDTAGEQKNLLRALMNVRMPEPIPAEYLEVQDEYLQQENARGGFTTLENIQPCAMDGRLYLWQGDITTLQVDAIVNAANSALLGCFQPLHSCIDNIIHSKAGLQLRDACNCLMKEQGYPEPTGKAKITPGFNLPCKYVLHTVGPIVDGPLTAEHERLLASCYTSCLNLAEENHLESIAFCCISTGVFMFPNQRAAEIAVSTVRDWLDKTGSQMKVVFNVYKDMDLQIYQKLLE